MHPIGAAMGMVHHTTPSSNLGSGLVLAGIIACYLLASTLIARYGHKLAR